MADDVRNFTENKISQQLTVITWEGLDGDDTGKPVNVAHMADKCVQLGAIGGDTHGGATTILQGSNDPNAGSNPANAVWFTLTDVFGSPISRTTAATLRQIAENPLWIRPSQSGGTSGDLDVILVCKGDGIVPRSAVV